LVLRPGVEALVIVERWGIGEILFSVELAARVVADAVAGAA